MPHAVQPVAQTAYLRKATGAWTTGPFGGKLDGGRAARHATGAASQDLRRGAVTRCVGTNPTGGIRMQRRHNLARLTRARTAFGVCQRSRVNPCRPDTAPLHLQDCRIAGSHCYDCPVVPVRLRPGDPLDLRRESDNRHDLRVTAVFWRRHKLDYLPRRDNAAAGCCRIAARSRARGARAGRRCRRSARGVGAGEDAGLGGYAFDARGGTTMNRRVMSPHLEQRR